MTCTASVPAAPTIRGEGYAEKAADFVVDCTGGTPTADGAAVPTADFTLSLNATVTSRLFSNSWSEALVLVDEPGSGLTGAPATQLACNDANGVCSLTGAYRVTRNVKLSAGVDNLFDKDHTEHLNKAGDAGFGFSAIQKVPAPGRTFWTKVDFSF